jgi:hypothetical protein
VTFVGNSQNADPSVRQNFGFGAWVINLIGKSGKVLYAIHPSGSTTSTQSHRAPSVAGVYKVVFVGSHHQDPTCGGFAELGVRGYSTH